MSRLIIRHETRYDYERPVRFGLHRLLVRPRDSHAIRIGAATLTLSPPGETRWAYDALGNCVCWFSPQGEARRLTILSELEIERFPAPLAALPIHDPKSASPVDYDLTDRAVLAPFMAPADEDVEGLMPWLRGQAGLVGGTALEFLLRLTWSIHEQFEYIARWEEGVQSPARTLATGSGTCRDFAWLMVEGLRRLGYAARFVTGYLHSPGAAVRGAGATHAWCEVFLPELGWTEFDPTNGLAESSSLIPVAVSRTPAEAAPISGAIFGDPGRCDLTVDVDVSAAPPVFVAA
ncbi:transglutaminase family protein [Caulobacter sp. KR2-114]|uniref:transglutaminase family protein n=1 Tax=Caulobacter sp. KR2-114 TaxID=3400912 RepID=UPI003C09EB23